jgi:hypothetical protein
MTLVRDYSPNWLNRILDAPDLLTKIQSLDTAELAGLIADIGLEDAGEILGLATTEQLLGVIDMDVWRNERGGEDESFDPARFLLWLEVLLETGEARLVSRLTDLPEELVIMAFYAHILVLNLDDLAAEMDGADASDQTEKALSNCLGHEMEAYFIVAKQAEGWDTLLTAIVALDQHAPDLLEKILSRCCYASSEHIAENGGLYNVLTAEEMLATDAAADRSDRRARQGYIAPSDATAFFELALKTPPETLLTSVDPDPITRAYFREWDAAPAKNAEARDAHTMQTVLYLANIITAGLGASDAPIRPADAVQAVGLICEAGRNAVKHLLPSRRPPHTPEDLPLQNGFMLGWQTLSRNGPLDSLEAVKKAARK